MLYPGKYSINSMILMKFGTQKALISNVKINISCFVKIQHGHSFELYNFKITIYYISVSIQSILMKFGINVIGIISDLKVNI